MTTHLIFESIDALKKNVIKNRVGKIQVNTKWICIVWDGEQLYAFDEKCPHQAFSLAGTVCHEGQVVCPLHQFKFDLQNMKGHGLSLQSYEVLREGDAFYVVL